MTADIAAKAGEWLLTQGWAGIIVLLAVAVIWDQRRDIKDLRTRNTALQDKRVSDAQALTERTLTAIETTRAAVQAWTESSRGRRG